MGYSTPRQSIVSGPGLGAAQTLVLSYPQPVNAGSLLVGIPLSSSSNTNSSAADTTLNSWTNFNGVLGATGIGSSSFLYSLSAVGGTTTVTFTAPATKVLRAAILLEYPLSSASFDNGHGVNGVNTPTPSASFTPAFSSELLVGVLVILGSPTVTTPSNWTLEQSLVAGGISFYAFDSLSIGGTVPQTFAPTLNPSALVATQISGFTSPSTIWSPIDSRQAVSGMGPGPNTGILDSQSNVNYSAQNPSFSGNSQVSDNTAIPPVDSRVSKPVDSRVSIPVNSRTAPPFHG